MTTTMDITVKATVPGVTPVDSTWTVSVDAIDDMTFELADGVVDQLVRIQPGPATAVVHLSIVGPVGVSGVSYRAVPTAPAIPLDGTHAYVGSGMVALLAADPTALWFTNQSGNPASVRVFVARRV